MSYLFLLYQNLTDQKKRDSEKKRICTGIVHRRILSKGSTLLRGCWVWSKKLRFRKNFNAMTPVARLNLKKSLILWTFSRTLSFQFLFYCVLFCGLWSGFMKGIMKGYERLPPIMKGYERCSKMLRIWREIRWKEFCPFHKNTGFPLTLLEKDPQNLIKFEFWGELGKSRDFFQEQI
jgi:hypothetical protein